MCWYQLTWTPLQSWHLLDKIPKTHLQWHSLEGSWFAATFYCLPDQAHDLCVFSSWFWDMCWRHIKIVRVAWIYIYIQIYTHMAPQKKSRVAFIRIFAYIRICHIYYIYIYPKKISEVKDLKSWNTCDFLHPVGFKVLQDGWFFSTGSRRMTDHLHSFAWWQLLNRENSVLVGSRSFV